MANAITRFRRGAVKGGSVGTRAGVALGISGGSYFGWRAGTNRALATRITSGGIIGGALGGAILGTYGGIRGVVHPYSDETPSVKNRHMFGESVENNFHESRLNEGNID